MLDTMNHSSLCDDQWLYWKRRSDPRLKHADSDKAAEQSFATHGRERDKLCRRNYGTNGIKEQQRQQMELNAFSTHTSGRWLVPTPSTAAWEQLNVVQSSGMCRRVVWFTSSNILSPCSSLMMEISGSSGTSVCIYRHTWLQTEEECDIKLHNALRNGKTPFIGDQSIAKQ